MKFLVQDVGIAAQKNSIIATPIQNALRPANDSH